MATRLIPECVEVKTRYINVASGETYLHVFHARTPDVPELGDCEAIAAIVAGWFGTTWAAAQSNQLLALDVTATSRAVVPGPQAAVLVNLAGDNATALLPGQVALALKKQTGLSGRSNRGRFFAGPIEVGHDLDGIFDLTWVNSIVDVYEDLRNSLEDGSYPLTVASNTWGTQHNVTAIVATDGRADTMRSRAPGRGI